MPNHAVQRAASITIPITLALFAGGGAAGAALANAIAPGSVVGAFFGLFMLPAAFIGGFYAWLGLALLNAIGQWVRRRRGRNGAATPIPREPDRMVPPGSIAFLLMSLVSSAMAGFALAFLSTEWSLGEAWALVVLVGAAYGVLCWLLARSGFLPFPEGD
jgi:hypothetical protein